jgi:hypothetical protein
VNSDAARRLTAGLSAAYPGRMPDSTHALYVTELATLDEHDVAEAAIHELIRTEEYLPTIAAIRAAYFDALDRLRDWRALERGLPEGEPDRGAIDPAVLAEIERLLGRPFRPFRDMDDAA